MRSLNDDHPAPTNHRLYSVFGGRGCDNGDDYVDGVRTAYFGGVCPGDFGGFPNKKTAAAEKSNNNSNSNSNSNSNDYNSNENDGSSPTQPPHSTIPTPTISTPYNLRYISVSLLLTSIMSTLSREMNPIDYALVEAYVTRRIFRMINCSDKGGAGVNELTGANPASAKMSAKQEDQKSSKMNKNPQVSERAFSKTSIQVTTNPTHQIRSAQQSQHSKAKNSTFTNSNSDPSKKLSLTQADLASIYSQVFSGLSSNLNGGVGGVISEGIFADIAPGNSSTTSSGTVSHVSQVHEVALTTAAKNQHHTPINSSVNTVLFNGKKYQELLQTNTNQNQQVSHFSSHSVFALALRKTSLYN